MSADRADAVLEIDLAGIVANWRMLAARVKPARCAAVVKADAYGLGAAQVSAALAALALKLRVPIWSNDRDYARFVYGQYTTAQLLNVLAV